MCRALLYLGQPVLLDTPLFRPDSALMRQSIMPRMLHTLNDDRLRKLRVGERP
jgi:hypothetical protein